MSARGRPLVGKLAFLALERISIMLPGVFGQVWRWTSSSVQNVLNSPIGLPPGVLALRPRHRQTWPKTPRGALLRCALVSCVCQALAAVEPPALQLPPPPGPQQPDPLIPQAWHLREMHVAEAWKITSGDPRVSLAFVDSGIDYNHPDLAPNLRWNAGEWPPNGIDDDGNGFIDDVIGWDFLHNRFLPWDVAGHGTFLSGLAAAVADNGMGSAGVCPKCTLLTCRFLNGDGFGDTHEAINGIRYATRMRAAVVNLSFADRGFDDELYEAIKEAARADVVIVAASSNDGIDIDDQEIYPAKYKLPEMITVAASNARGELWHGSNWGKASVHVAAPGEDVLGPWKSGWDIGSGTSDAAAIASGVLGLMRSANPKLPAAKVVAVALATVRRSPALQGKLKVPGVLDAVAAVRCAKDPLLPCLKY